VFSLRHEILPALHGYVVPHECGGGSNPMTKLLLGVRAVLGFSLMFCLLRHLNAETIYLKNGMYIVVTKTEQKDDIVKYWVGDDEYDVAKSDILKIEPGSGPAPDSRMPISGSTPGLAQDLTRRDAPSVGSSNRDKLKLPKLAGPNQNDTYWIKLRDRITVRDTIDETRLAEIELQHDAHATADAYYLAGVVAMQRSDAAKAGTYFDHAIQARSDQPLLFEWHAIALAAQGRYSDAALDLERANALQPNSADLLRMLGLARYNADRTKDAISAWKTAQELSPDSRTEYLLHKAEREFEVEEASRSKETSHFTLHYQGERTPSEFHRQILDTLETAYQDLSRQLSYTPGENIIVVLYTQKQFEDITEAPSWAGALNDGKLRIPIGGINAMNPELARVLEHELTHSFIKSLARGRCPAWLNEGLAQLMEPRSSAMYAQQLVPLFQARKAIPFTLLEASFTRFSPEQAEYAYAESLAATEYLRTRFGMNEILHILQNIGAGENAEQALTQSTGLDYTRLQDRLAEYMAHM
jgi:tetratricopeptide (TPR) repeat protein